MSEKTTVIYNDTCPICSREVDGYKRLTAQDATIGYHGLSACDLARFGLTPDQAARRFHVVKGGQLLSGMPAFAALWQDIPRLRWLARVVRAPIIRPAVGALYDHVAAPILYKMHKRRQRRAG
ncbi:thiol-disulfide oxidoreductase DCC family protein [Tropicibacter naphthalenivorans]|nr:DUF393 domain-containing protein [Tropicibacter naphthalenivorans]